MASEWQSFQQRVDKVIEKAQSMNPEELVFRYKGLLYPTLLSSEQTLTQRLTFQARREDVLFSAYPKCGFNWIHHMLWDIVHANDEEEQNYALTRKFAMLEFGTPEKFEEMKRHPSPRLYGTHSHYDNLPKSISEKKTKILVLLRNPKDNAVSYYHFYQNNPLLPCFPSWDEFFKKYMTGEVFWGSYFDHAFIWNQHIDDENVMLVTFEELKENLEEGVKKMAMHFGFSLTEEQIKKIAGRGTFKSMSENSQITHYSFGKCIFRKGEVGDWKNHFTKEQSQEMDSKFEECLAGTKLGAKLKYNIYCKA
ncbi:sulfotransferase 6B1-like [Callorhinchus milii]|uniref:sulfotransferase 6B1-like n=1 Tax=Callorhinchus milii TaxID=7868 RepID=UPI001C3F525B|nr:sulfotransferase 6B1-like [Callorhinchus milii]